MLWHDGFEIGLVGGGCGVKPHLLHFFRPKSTKPNLKVIITTPYHNELTWCASKELVPFQWGCMFKPSFRPFWNFNIFLTSFGMPRGNPSLVHVETSDSSSQHPINMPHHHAQSTLYHFFPATSSIYTVHVASYRAATWHYSCNIFLFL